MLADPHLLLCHDGSDQATEGIDFAAALFSRGSPATALYAWEPAAVAVSGGMIAVSIPPDAAEEDEARAKRIAETGAHHVAQHALCPVLIMPGAEIGEARRGLSRANERAA
jgi:hypothetical protein